MYSKLINGVLYKVKDTVNVKEVDGDWRGKIISFRPGGWVVLHDVTHGKNTSAVFWRNENQISPVCETANV